MRAIHGVAIAALVLLLGAGAWYLPGWAQKREADQIPLEHEDYVRLGRLKLTDPVYRMGSMIDLQCKVLDDFILTKGEEKSILQLASRLRKKPEQVEDVQMHNCMEWEKEKARR